MVNVGKYTIHGFFGYWWSTIPDYTRLILLQDAKAAFKQKKWKEIIPWPKIHPKRRRSNSFFVEFFQALRIRKPLKTGVILRTKTPLLSKFKPFHWRVPADPYRGGQLPNFSEKGPILPPKSTGSIWNELLGTLKWLKMKKSFLFWLKFVVE